MFPEKGLGAAVCSLAFRGGSTRADAAERLSRREAAGWLLGGEGGGEPGAWVPGPGGRVRPVGPGLVDRELGPGAGVPSGAGPVVQLSGPAPAVAESWEEVGFGLFLL